MRFCLIAFAIGLAASSPAADAPPRVSPEPTPVLVELFTSEGCSSCPPADRLLESLAREQPLPGVEILVIGEHVDYWDSHGWKDPFSDPAFTKRQRWYSMHWPLRVYTPQAVIDGVSERLGSNREKLLKAVARAAKRPKAEIALQAEATPQGKVRLSVEIRNLTRTGTSTADVYAAIVADGVESDVASGENRGRKLRHWAAARRLTLLGKARSKKDLAEITGEIEAIPANVQGNSRLIVFAQSKKNRRIVAAVTAPYPRAGIARSLE